jgi:hypothetical protein
MVGSQKDVETMRLNYIGAILQEFLHTILFVIFSYNTYRAILLLRKKTHYLLAWCCIISSSYGVFYTSLSLTSNLFSNGATCHHVLWLASSGLSVGSMCVSTALLQKAYLAHGRNKKLLIIGIIMIIPQPIVAYMGMSSPVQFVSGLACVAFYPGPVAWIKFALEAPINTVFSIAFITVVYRQYQQHGKKAWKRLAHDGIRTIGLVIICNFVCMVAAATHALGGASEYLFVTDWIITSTLLIRHCLDMTSMAINTTSQSFLEMKVFDMDSNEYKNTEIIGDLESNITYHRLRTTTHEVGTKILPTNMRTSNVRTSNINLIKR